MIVIVLLLASFPEVTFNHDDVVIMNYSIYELVKI